MHEDLYLPIAQALANPLLCTPQQRRLYQLWRTDFAALARLALVCRDAAAAVRALLWTHTALGARERERRAQVAQAHAFLAAVPLIADASWTRVVSAFLSDRVHIRSRVGVAFNGRIRMREYLFRGRRQRQRQPSPQSPLVNFVGLTLTSANACGRMLIAIRFGLSACLIVWSGVFDGHASVLSSLYRLTYLGRERWRRRLPPVEVGLLQLIRH
jgi:hypothetical protein